jgi:hypothetical protein
MGWIRSLVSGEENLNAFQTGLRQYFLKCVFYETGNDAAGDNKMRKSSQNSQFFIEK